MAAIPKVAPAAVLNFLLKPERKFAQELKCGINVHGKSYFDFPMG